MIAGDPHHAALDLEAQGDVEVFRDVAFGPICDIAIRLEHADILNGCKKENKVS